MPVQHYRASLKITPVTQGDRAFVEWWATFDCAPERQDEWRGFFRGSFGRRLSSLRGVCSAYGRLLGALGEVGGKSVRAVLAA